MSMPYFKKSKYLMSILKILKMERNKYIRDQQIKMINVIVLYFIFQYNKWFKKTVNVSIQLDVFK